MAAKKKQTLSLKTLENNLEKYFGKQAPQLPESVKKAIVDFGPWLLILGVLASIPALIALLGFTYSAPLYYRAWGRSSLGITSMVIPLVASGFSLVALPGLFKKSIKAWRLLFYSSLIYLLGNIADLNFVSLVVGTGISWYVLFQIKSYYK